jgi:glucokinase
MPAWMRVPFPAMLSKALGVPSFMENDANCAGLGEYASGAGRGATCMVLYTLGTGVGGGIVIDGKLWVGHNGGAGELGHMSIDPRGPVCGCGQRGCVEVYASATAVARRYAALSGRDGADAREVFRRARAGDSAARRATDEAARALGTGVAATLHVLHPDIVVISGGMAAAWGLLPRVRAEVRQRVFPLYLEGLRIVRGELGDDAGWIGAAMVAKDRS